MKWWNNQILQEICTVLGGIAAVGYLNEKISALIPSGTSSGTSAGLEWWEILIGIAIIIVPYIFIHYILINSRKALTEQAEKKAGWGPFAEHYINVSEYWQLGLTGFFVSLRGQVFIILFAFTLMLYLKWIYQNLSFLHFNYAFTLSSRHIITYGIPALTALYLINLAFKRFNLTKEAKRKSLMRKLADALNCDAFQIQKDKITFEEFCNDICGIVAAYFRLLINEPTIQCVMKIAISEKQGDASYKITGSSKNSFSMKAISNNISLKDGIAKFFLNKNAQGVLIVLDVYAAAEHGIISNEEVDNLWHVFDVNYLLVSPLVWFEESRSVILGFIYLTSNNNIFNANQIDEIRIISDLISPNLNRIAEQLHAQGRS